MLFRKNYALRKPATYAGGAHTAGNDTCAALSAAKLINARPVVNKIYCQLRAKINASCAPNTFVYINLHIPLFPVYISLVSSAATH